VEKETNLKVDFSSKGIKMVLQYLYSGQFHIDIESMNELILIGDKWGLVEFNKKCFDFMGNSLDSKSVVSLLVKAQKREFEFDVKDLIQKCFDQICKTAQEIFPTDLIYSINFDTMITLISSDALCLDEYDLFEHLLTWAKSESVKSKVDLDVLLDSVMKCVRWPQMSAETLYYKIKPMEEKNNWKWCSQDVYISGLEYNLDRSLFDGMGSLFKARNSSSFGNSKIIDGRIASLLMSWLPTTVGKKTKLLYSQVDGMTASDFHRLCDNQGPTVVIIKSTQGNVFGGFAPQPWSQSNIHNVLDKESFLFTIVNQGNVDPAKMAMVNQKQKGMFCHVNNGPSFGKGDILLSNSFGNNNSNTCKPFSYCYPGTSKKPDFLAGSNAFTVEKIEVFGFN
jgi:hypothetical protein